MCVCPHSRLSRAFTLIELLVVVAIIALLVSILLPSLQHAREQARIAVCLTNMRNIGQAANAYIIDNNNLPWCVPYGFTADGQEYSFRVITEWIWGGAMPSSTRADWRDAGWPGSDPYRKDNHMVPPRHRPLNPYMADTVYWDAEPANPVASARDDQPETPGFFICPSDTNPFPPIVGQSNPSPIDDDPESCWYFWGSSYPINWYWPYYYMRNPPDSGYRNDFSACLGADLLSQNLRGLGRDMLRGKLERGASEFIIFYENQLNFALEAARPPGYTGGPWASQPKSLPGWHGQQDNHIAVFLDGSARYQYFDTHYVFGANWSIWPNKPWDGPWAPYNNTAP